MAISPATAAEKIIATINDSLLLLDAEGRIMHANGAACLLLERSGEDLREKPFSSLLASRNSKKGVLAKILKGVEIRNDEVTFNNRHGKEIPVLLTTSLLTDQVGEPAGMVCTARDITARKATEQALAKANDELERQNLELRTLDKMKDSFISAVSHELKTPVAKHFMQLEVLRPMLKAYNLSTHERWAFRVMEESIRRQQQVIRNLLDLSRLEAGGVKYTVGDVRLDTLLEEVLSDYRYAVEYYGITSQLTAPPLTIRSDREMLWHVFSNLVGNAIKFRKLDDPEVVVSVRHDDTHVLVQVADNGIGIDPLEREKLFTRFYQRTPSSEGSGVGLTICQMIIKGLGGTIWVESEGMGKGAAVCVRLPAATERNT
jgi:PAS domain S-box-containing protein